MTLETSHDSTRMAGVVVLMLLAALWGVVQLAVLGSLTRSVRLSTLLLAVAAGCYAGAGAALALQLGWTRAYAAATGQPLAAVVERAGYTVDPVIEEVVKVLLVLLVVLLTRRGLAQRGLTDHLLLGAAVGAGFTFTEAVLRYGGRASRATAAYDGGFTVSTALLSSVHIPGPVSVLTTWLPAPTVAGGLLELGDDWRLDLHLAWTSLAGFGLGVLLRTAGSRRWLGLVPLVAVALDHVTFNDDLTVPGHPGAVVGTFAAAHRLLWLGPLVALAAATVLDLRAARRVRTDDGDPLIAAERSGSGSLLALARLASLAPPWTLLVAWRFTLVRRSARYAAAGTSPAAAELRNFVAGLVDLLDRAADPAAWREASTRLGLRFVHPRQLLRWPVVVWAVLLMPVLLYYVVGAVPPFGGVQRWLSGPVAFAVVGVLSSAGLLWTGWQLVGLVRHWRRVAQDPWGEPVLRLGLRLTTALGAFAAGLVVLALWLSGARSGGQHVLESFHVLDALSDALFVAAVLLILAAAVMFPPFALVALEGGGAILVFTGVTAELAVGIGASALLGTSGVLLSEASGGSSSSGSAGSGGRPPTRAERIEELSRDPAHGGKGGKASSGNIREAEVGVEMEERGLLRRPVDRSKHEGADLVDGNGQLWDVKSFRSEVPGRRGRFDLERALKSIKEETHEKIGVILDTRHMSASDVAALRRALEQEPGLKGLIKWY